MAARLRAQARRAGVSAATVLHVVWSRVLAAVSGRDDVVFGTLLLGRTQSGEGAGDVPGLFINTLPVRARMAGTDVGGALDAMHHQLAELMVHEHASLAAAQRAGGVRAPAPLFTAVFNYRHNTSGGPGTVLPPGTELLAFRERTTYPLLVSVDDDGRALAFDVQAAAPLDPALVTRLLHATTERVVDALEHAPGTSLADLDVLPDAERHRILTEGNGTGHSDADRTLVDVFADRAAATPQAVALTYDHDGAPEELDYAGLDARANRLARHLIGRGVGPEDRVMLLMDRSPDLVVALLAVLKSGAAYVPVDPDQPAERIAHLYADAAPAAVLTSTAHAASLPAFVAAPIVVDDPAVRSAVAAHALEPITQDERTRRLRPAHPAYAIYTSGSTGTPKGVVVPHSGAVNLLAFRWPGLTAESRLLQFASIGFDVATWEIMTAFAAGPVSSSPPPSGCCPARDSRTSSHGTRSPTCNSRRPSSAWSPTTTGWPPCARCWSRARPSARASWTAGAPTAGSATPTARPRSASSPPPTARCGPAPPRPSAAPCPVSACTSWTHVCVPSPTASTVICTSQAPVWPAATWACPLSVPNASWPTPTEPSAPGCTAPVTPCAAPLTAACCTSGAPTTRSRSAASASNRARSRSGSPSTQASRTPQ
ncbi:AMP-binding protein [Streptomyces albus]|nr:AMP-binding protein [Streptomyces albus]